MANYSRGQPQGRPAQQQRTANTSTTTAGGRSSLVVRFASRFGIDPDKMLDTLKATAFRQRGKNGAPPPEITNEQMAALLTVAERYDLDPFVKQIYAFPNKAGGIEPIVPIDGWLKIINTHPQFQDMELIYPDGGEPDEIFPWIGCRIWRKDRQRPTEIRELFNECKRDTDPWKEMPTRMLRHKAIIQCGRVAFNLSGIYDPDEGERINQAIDAQFESAPPRVGKSVSQAPEATKAIPAPANDEQLALIREQIETKGITENDVCTKFDLGKLTDLKFDYVQPVLAWIHEVAG